MRKRRDSAFEELANQGYLNLKEKRKVHEAVFTQKALIGKHPENINEKYLDKLPLRETRSAFSGKLNIPKHRTAKFQNSTIYKTITTWNEVPEYIKCGNTNTLKINYQKYLVNKTYNLKP